jgi:hypothetical protein
MTRKIFPVSGSLSTLASVGSIVFGTAFEMASWFAVEVLDTSPARSFSIPPVAELRRDVRPSRR